MQVFISTGKMGEFGFMVGTGMPAMETIQSAIITNAKLWQMVPKLGQIQKGFY